ncbi:MAG: NADH-quinone oxidoreductase subunit I [Syntrophorhabdaceae bacterium PtaU1.Bin034]|jgi:NADH-quinone oxidoreductase chain I|nr:MAG: NADH-quinone oxidoreductase subunit I [Syntrophorhabdaceae bacterium PtaU1.Bin034]
MIIPLLKGLRLTLARFFSRPITIQYPEEKKTPPPRWRGIHYFDKDEKGDTTCVACGLCVAICPSRCIYLEIGEREDGQRYPARYEIDELRCIFCGYCQEACPVNAIRLGKGFEYVKYERSDFILTKEKLLSMYEGKE